LELNMPRSSAKKTAGNNAAGYWVTYETDMGPVPRGTPGLCMKDCMTAPDDAGNDCVLFWANHHASQGKKDGNVWIVGQWQKCQRFNVSGAAWPGGNNAKKAAENLLNSIFANGDHKTVLIALGLLMKAGSPGTCIIDGPGEGAWRFPTTAE
jgi:hypothetical protein